ncbi:MAG: alpha/beta fold hydrolase [bacterium]
MVDLESIKEIYPFKQNYLIINDLRYHYLDEGQGEPIVMLHGNPTWSFYYRELVKEFRKTHRIIVPDHIGCGLSDKPQRYNYTLQTHINNLDKLLTHLSLNNITLLMHDWGGAIGMGYAVRNPEKIKQFIVLNTAAFTSSRIPFRIALCKVPFFGDILLREFNLFACIAITMAVHKKKLPPKIREGLLLPYNNWANRVGILRFVQDIPLSSKHISFKTLKKIEEGLKIFQSYPMMLLWGEHDFCFNHFFLEEWIRRFPEAEVYQFAEAGHYVVEDALEEIIPLIYNFLFYHTHKS